MKNNLIRIFINEKNVIEISPYASLYSLKEQVNKKVYKNLPFDNISLHFKGKPLIDNSKALLSYGIENDSILLANVKTNGGYSTSTLILIGFYMLAIPCYFIFLMSGLPPVMANIFSFVFDNTVLGIFEYFQKKRDDNFLEFIRNWIIKPILSFITIFSTIIFIWITTAYIVFPFYYLIRGKTYCDAGLTAKHVGKITTIGYMMVYGSFNILDFLLNITQYATNFFPVLLIKGTASASIQTTKEAWDLTKFAPFYAIPFLGQMLMTFHIFLEEGIGLLYESLDVIGQYNCDDENTTSLLCSLTTQLQKELAKYGGTGHHTHTKENKSIASKYKKQDMNAKIQSRIDKMQSRLEIKEMAGIFIEPVKNYKLEPLLKLLQRGFCDQALKDKIQQGVLNKGLEPLTEDQLNAMLPKLDKTDFDMNTFKGRLNRWSSGFFMSFFCQILEALRDITNTLWGIGTENQVINMIKTGQIAGIVAIVVFIIDTILNM